MSFSSSIKSLFEREKRKRGKQIGNGHDEWLDAKSGSCWTGSSNSFSSGEEEMCSRSNMNILILRTDWIGSFYAARPF